MPKKLEYSFGDKVTPDKPIDSWPNFANNFLYNFFEGRSFTIWLFVSCVLLGLLSYLKISGFAIYFAWLLIIFVGLQNIIQQDPFGIITSLRRKFKIPFVYKKDKWTARIVGREWKKLGLPLVVERFQKISTLVKILNHGNGRWRAGVILENSIDNKEYIFHAFQDSGSLKFHTRIVERVPGVREVAEVQKNDIGLGNSYEFILAVEKKGDELAFYIDGINVGTYSVPLDRLSHIIVAAWSDDQPIEVLFEQIEAYV